MKNYTKLDDYLNRAMDGVKILKEDDDQKFRQLYNDIDWKLQDIYTAIGKVNALISKRGSIINKNKDVKSDIAKINKATQKITMEIDKLYNSVDLEPSS